MNMIKFLINFLKIMSKDQFLIALVDLNHLLRYINLINIYLHIMNYLLLLIIINKAFPKIIALLLLCKLNYKIRKKIFWNKIMN
jgi:hypothetical protein